MNFQKSFSLITAMYLLFISAASAAPINVLWVSGTNSYNNSISTLSSGGTNDAANYDPDSDGSNSWSIDFWDAADPTPIFGNYDALVVGSTCIDSCPGSTGGFFNLGVDPQQVLDSEAEITAARGNRTFVSGQDADWHFINGGRTNAQTDAMAFLINAVNWAASGTGMGVVVLADGYISGGINGWLDHEDSFLKDEIGNARTVKESNSVLIPVDSEDFPINEGLTSAALSGWNTSSHTAFEESLLPSGWKAINDAGCSSCDGLAVTIVTASEAGGGTVAVPEPSIVVLLSVGLLFVARARRA